MALWFRDSEALHVVLTSGLCPAEVREAGARVAAHDGGLVLAPAKALPRAAMTTLRALGVGEIELPDGARDVASWAEALPLRRVAVGAIPSQVMFVIDGAGVIDQTAPPFGSGASPGEAGLVDVAAELVRLGCDRQELLAHGALGAIRVVDPPTYTVERALDREGGLRCYAPSPAGQDAVWTELGYAHPLAAQLRPEVGSLLLLGADGWRTLPDAGWFAVDAALELRVPAGGAVIQSAAPWQRRAIELRLASGRRAVPSLWVLRRGGVAAIDALLASVPEEVVARLTFAVGAGEGEPIVILRARGGRQAPPDLSLAAEAYAPLGDLADVFAPADAIVEPPLRRDRLRAIVGATGTDVVWLAPLGDRRFRVERIADRAFLPLAEWADYVLHASAPALEPWMRSPALDFAPFVSTGLEWAEAPPEPEERGEPATGRRKRARVAAPTPTPELPVRQVMAAPEAAPGLRPREALVSEIALDAELVALEAEFVALDAPGDAPARLGLFARLGDRYLRAGRRQDAGLCFVRTVWEARRDEVVPLLDAWLELERATAAQGASAANWQAHLLAGSRPEIADVRAVVAMVARMAEAGPRPDAVRDAHRFQRWLDAHDGELDARSLWLARLALARLVGGDPLGLAHARDRVLARLASGLAVEHELPSFLRIAGRSGALGSASNDLLGTALEDVAARLAKIKRKRSPVEAPPALTGAYVVLLLATGFARIGRPDRARALVAEAQAALPLGDAVHGYLFAAFAARVEQALAGLPPETPLPDDVIARLAALDRVSRYKVDRLREMSRVLEPVERPDAIGAFSRNHDDARGPEFAALRAITDPRERGKHIAALVARAAAEPAERERLIDGVLDVLLALPEATAAPILGRAIPLIADVAEARRAVLYAEALIVAGHFARADLVPSLLARLGTAIRVVSANELDRVLQHSLRALRRIGLRSEMAALLVDAEHALPANEAESWLGRLALAAGLAYLDDASGLPILDRARQALGEAFKALADRPGLMRPLELTRALALAYAHVPIGVAIAGITELTGHFKDITDNFGTNSHYCLSVLHFVESLVLGVTSDDLALGEAGRRFIEDDEHLIRRRLHRDLGDAS